MQTAFIVTVSIIILSLSGLFSGLTLGLMSISPFELKRKKELGNKQAALVYPLRIRGHELLVTLIICNALLNSTLAVFLDMWLFGPITIVVVTILITIFAEVLPQAFLKKHGLQVGAKLAPTLSIIMKALKPISVPLALYLDKLVGEEKVKIYSKEELYKVLDEHEIADESDIDEQELSLIKHSLSFKDKKVKDVMTPKSAIETVKESEIIGPVVLKELHDSGHSKFPVYRHSLDNIVGILSLEDCVGLKTTQKARDLVSAYHVKYLNQDQPLTEALAAFLDAKQYLFIVIDKKERTVGVVTLRDIVEEIMDRQPSDIFKDYDNRSIVATLTRNNNHKENSYEK
ncbi:DUF21 domain-containing protein [Candidatus Saccharibacteria bacterium CPR2]|nr:DUF21 domain-containing protein [Candidatus Saccharibacteria bacterium CPR2]